MVQNPFNGIERYIYPNLTKVVNPLRIHSMELKVVSNTSSLSKNGGIMESIQWNWKGVDAGAVVSLNTSTLFENPFNGIESLSLLSFPSPHSHLNPFNGIERQNWVIAQQNCGAGNPFNGIERSHVSAELRAPQSIFESIQWNWKDWWDRLSQDIVSQESIQWNWKSK